MELFRRCFYGSLLVGIPVSAVVWAVARNVQQSLPLNARFEDAESGVATATFVLCAFFVILKETVSSAIRRPRNVDDRPKLD